MIRPKVPQKKTKEISTLANSHSSRDLSIPNNLYIIYHTDEDYFKLQLASKLLLVVSLDQILGLRSGLPHHRNCYFQCIFDVEILKKCFKRFGNFAKTS